MRPQSREWRYQPGMSFRRPMMRHMIDLLEGYVDRPDSIERLYLSLLASHLVSTHPTLRDQFGARLARVTGCVFR
jgi:hypothetical protein